MKKETINNLLLGLFFFAGFLTGFFGGLGFVKSDIVSDLIEKKSEAALKAYGERRIKAGVKDLVDGLIFCIQFIPKSEYNKAYDKSHNLEILIRKKNGECIQAQGQKSEIPILNYNTGEIYEF